MLMFMDTERQGTSVDLGVVGYGPAGLFATYYAGLRDLTVGVIDSLAEPGGQVTALLPGKAIYDVAAHPQISGRRLVDALLQQVARPPDPLLLEHTVVDLQRLPARADTRSASGWQLRTDRGAVLRCAAVVLSVGAGSFSPRRLPCAAPFIGAGASYGMPATPVSDNHDVIVVGGGDTAVDSALALLPTARSVTVVHRSGQFRAHERSVATLHASGAAVLTSAEVLACHGDGRLTAVTVGSHTGNQRQLPASHLVVALGLITRPGPLQRWGLALRGSKIIVDSAMQTALPRVFAVGDAVTYTGKVPLITAGFGEAATAVNNAAALIRPQQGVDPGHSSSRPRALR